MEEEEEITLIEKSPLHRRLGKIFMKAQKTIAAHPKCLEKLLKIFKEFHPQDNELLDEEFMDTFTEMWQPILLAPYPRNITKMDFNQSLQKDTPIQRLITCLVDFCCKLSAEYVFEIILRLLAWHSAKNANVRFQVLHLITKLLYNLSAQNVEVEDSLWNQLCKICLERMSDSKAAVRAQACAAAHRLQDRDDADDPFIRSYVSILQHDSNATVRRTAVRNICITSGTSGYLIERTRDVNALVREAVFIRLMRTSMKFLKRELVIKFLLSGLQDPDKSVQIAAKKLLITWFQKRKKDGYVDGFSFTKFLITDYEEDVIDHQIIQDVAFILQTVYNEVLGDDQIVDEQIRECVVNAPKGKFSSASAFYWRCLSTFYVEKRMIQDLSHISISCNRIVTAIENTQLTSQKEEFKVEQLLKLAQIQDMNENDKLRMKELVLKMLTKFKKPSLFVEDLVQLLNFVSTTPNDYMNTILECVDQCRADAKSLQEMLDNPELRKQHLADLNKRLESKKIHIQKCKLRRKSLLRETEEWKKHKDLQSHLYFQIKRLKTEIELAKSEQSQRDRVVLILARALLIISSYMKFTPNHVENLLYLVDTFFIPLIDHESDELKSLSIRCLGQFCACKPNLAEQHILKIVDVLRYAKEVDVLKNAIYASFDILMQNDFSIFDSERSSMIEGSLVKGWTEFFELNNETLEVLCVEGLCKLLLNDKLSLNWEADILSKFLYLQWRPESSEGPERGIKVKQILATFFRNYPSKSDKMKLLADVFIPTLRKILNSTDPAVYEDFPLDKMLNEFPTMLALHHIQHHQNFAVLKIHENFALHYLMEILTMSDNTKNTKLLWKQFVIFLQNATLHSENDLELRAMYYLLQKAMDQVLSEQSKKLWNAGLKCIKQACPDDDVSLSREEKDFLLAAYQTWEENKQEFIDTLRRVDTSEATFSLIVTNNNDPPHPCFPHREFGLEVIIEENDDMEDEDSDESQD